MAARVAIHNGITAAICIQINFVELFRIKVIYIIRIEESAGLGVVVSGLEVVQRGLGIVVITAVSERVDMRDMLGVGEFDTAGIAVRVGSFYHQYTKLIKICQENPRRKPRGVQSTPRGGRILWRQQVNYKTVFNLKYILLNYS